MNNQKQEFSKENKEICILNNLSNTLKETDSNNGLKQASENTNSNFLHIDNLKQKIEDHKSSIITSDMYSSTSLLIEDNKSHGKLALLVVSKFIFYTLNFFLLFVFFDNIPVLQIITTFLFCLITPFLLATTVKPELLTLQQETIYKITMIILIISAEIGLIVNWLMRNHSFLLTFHSFTNDTRLLVARGMICCLLSWFLSLVDQSFKLFILITCFVFMIMGIFCIDILLVLFLNNKLGACNSIYLLVFFCNYLSYFFYFRYNRNKTFFTCKLRKYLMFSYFLISTNAYWWHLLFCLKENKLLLEEIHFSRSN